MKCWIGISFVLGVLLGVGVVRSQQSAIGMQRIVQFENDDVKVWKSIVVLYALLTMHCHEHGCVIIVLRGGIMNIVEQSGASESHVWDIGKAYWLSVNASGIMHVDVNVGDQSIEVMVVELKKDKQFQFHIRAWLFTIFTT